MTQQHCHNKLTPQHVLRTVERAWWHLVDGMGYLSSCPGLGSGEREAGTVGALGAQAGEDHAGDVHGVEVRGARVVAGAPHRLLLQNRNLQTA